jgi:hypothetical protein
MSVGFEGFIAVQETQGNQGYGGTYVEAGNNSCRYLYVDTDGLNWGQAINDNQDKLIQGASPLVGQRNYGARTPGGDITYQPRSNDSLGILMACYQNVVATGTSYKGAGGTYTLGTWTFFRAERGEMSWDGGSSWGTNGTNGDVYAIDVIRKYSDALLAGSAVFVWNSAIVSELDFTHAIGKELQFKPTLKAYGLTATTAFPNPPAAAGSYSNLQAYVQKAGTLTLTYNGVGTLWNVTSFSHKTNNNNFVKSTLGRRDPSSYPYGKAENTGVLELEMDNSVPTLDFLNDEGTYSLSLREFNSTEDWIQSDAPQIKISAIENPLVSGMVPQRISYTCYRPVGGSCAFQVTVCTRGTSTQLWGTP